MVRFDGYSATTSALKPDDVVPWFMELGTEITQGRGFHTFGERLAFKDGSGHEVGSLSYGGSQGDRIMVEVKGEASPVIVERLRASAAHRCTRADACADWDRPGVFDELLGHVMAVKETHRLYGERRGDWDYPEKGRTQYLGATSSAVRVRLYEKGKQPEYLHLERPDFCRVEVQVRPQKEAKEDYSRLDAIEVWGASKFTRDLAARLLEKHLDPHPPGTVRRESQRDRALRFMCRQYGPHLISLKDDLGGWDVVGLTLGEMVKEERALRDRLRVSKGGQE